MYDKHESIIHNFYNCVYLKNRYPSAYYVSTNFLYPENPDIVSVALGYKPSVLLSSEELKSDFNDYYATKCYYRGKELFYLDEDNVVICDREDSERFRAIFKKENTSKEWGMLLGYPEHLVNIFVECCEGREIPDWGKYDNLVDEMACKIVFNLS